MQPEIVLLKIRHIQKANVSFFLSYVESIITFYVRIYIDGYVYVCRICLCVGHKIKNSVTKLKKTSKGGGRKKMTEYRTPCDLKIGGARRIWGKGSQPVRRKERPHGRKVRRAKA